MKCKIVIFLYWIFPNKKWQAYLIQKHFSSCERCQKRIDSDTHIKSLLISAEDLHPRPDLWTDMEEAIKSYPKIRKPVIPESKPIIFPKWQWIAAALILTGLIILIPIQILKNRPDAIQKTTRNQIVLKSIKIEESTAKAYFFQSKNPNRLIIWAQKTN
ncbi:MAG: hypothetical protein KAT17_05720 [Candidatus Aminicenantes bacterium]|nr:hypothetical protein [Candidatus Aminicenantes bacterium]